MGLLLIASSDYRHIDSVRDDDGRPVTSGLLNGLCDFLADAEPDRLAVEIVEIECSSLRRGVRAG